MVPSRPLPANEPWLLTSATSLAFVIQGTVDVFACTALDADTPSHRRFLGRLETGALMTPLPASALGPYTVIAVGSTETLLEVHPSTEQALRRLATTNTAALGAWFDMILLACDRASGHTSTAISLTPRLTVDVETGDLLSAHTLPVWCPTEDVRPVADIPWPRTLLFRPVTAQSPVVATTQGSIQPLDSATVVTSMDVVTTLDEIAVMLRLAIERHDVAEEAISLSVLQGRMTKRTATSRLAIQEFASVMGERSSDEAPTQSTDPVIATVERLARALHTPFTVPPTWSTTGSGRIEHLFEAGRMRTRQVALEGAWYRQIAGPLVGYTSDGEPVALLERSGAYHAFHADGTVIPISQQSVSGYAQRGLQVYRPFPVHALLFKDILRFGFGPLRKDLVTLLLAGSGAGLVALFLPSITAALFDDVIPLTDRTQLLVITLGIVVAAIVSAVFELTRNVAVLRLQLQSDASLQAALWDRLLTLPATFFRSFTAGELATRANGFNAIQQLIAGSAANSLVSVIFSTFQIALLFHHSSRLAWWAVGILGASACILVSISYGRYRYITATQDIYQRITGTILQLLSAIAKLRATASETYAFRMWSSMFRTQRANEFRASRLQIASRILYTIVPTVATMVFYYVVDDMRGSEHALDTGAVLSFISAFSLFFASLMASATAAESLLMCVPLYTYAQPILTAVPEVDEAKPHPGTLSGAVEFVGVTFRYDADGPPTVDNVSFTVKPGEFVAIVGASGSGKSTLMRLLLGFEQAEAGSIYVDGLDIRDVDIRAVRRQMGVVLQNGKLMAGDIAKNITGANPLLTIDDAWEAAMMAGFDDEIRAMPMGMQTVISEGGGALSGGQRQRLLIARAVAAKPRIILMDEATSALDNRTQAIVSEALDRMHATRIIIAHRLSTIIHADRIYVMQRGNIVEHGTYPSLMARNGVFAALAQRQMA